jgi:hypothetical protein
MQAKTCFSAFESPFKVFRGSSKQRGHLRQMRRVATSFWRTNASSRETPIPVAPARVTVCEKTRRLTSHQGTRNRHKTANQEVSSETGYGEAPGLSGNL